MGNQLIPNTNINKEAVGNCGANVQWQMHQGVRTDKTKEPVTVFLFDKRTISKQNQASKEEFINGLKRDPQILGKFKHQGIVTLTNPLLEDQKRIGFVTEPVKTSLNLLIDKNSIGDIVESELEVKLHILDIAETLVYLHNDVKAAHLSISPENIYITNEGKWKLGGFLFSTQILQGDTGTCPADFSQKTGQIRLTPNLKFTAPEVTETPSRCTFTSDIFSLACLIFTLYKIKANASARDPYLINANSLHGYREIIQHLHRLDYSPIPDQIRSTVMRMLHSDPSMRISAAEFVNHNWFKDPFVQTVKCLETIHQRDLTQQANFLKGLSTIILKFEPKFLKRKLIPILNSLVKNPQLASNVLPIYFAIMEQQNPPVIAREEFNTFIWPSIRLLVTAKEITASALFILIQKLDLFVAFLEIKEVETIFVPILLKCLDCGVQKLQDLAIQQTLIIFDKIDYAVLKSQIMPKILNLCLDANQDLRKAAVLMLSKTFHVFDSVMINDQILPTLDKLRKLNNNYAINMAMLTVFQGIAKDIGTEVIANKILVSLIPMLIIQTFSKSEYKAYLSTVYSYLKRIEDEQNRRYEGMPDKPPEEAQPEPEKVQPPVQNQPPAVEGQFGGDFAFLNSSVPKGADVSSSKGEFDFSAFNNYNPQASQTSAPSQPSAQANNRASFDSKPSTKPFGVDNSSTQHRASMNAPYNPVPTGNKQPEKSAGLGFSPVKMGKDPVPQQNDPFTAFSGQAPAKQSQSFSGSNMGGFGQSGTSNVNKGNQQNPFAPQPVGQNTGFGAGTGQSKQNANSFDFQSFDQFGFGSQPQKQQQSQQPFSSDWGQPAPTQNQKASGNAGWGNLDEELASFSTTLAQPAPKTSQEKSGFGGTSNVSQTTSANNNPYQQQYQAQAQTQPQAQTKPQTQPQAQHQQQQQQYQQYQQQQQQQYQPQEQTYYQYEQQYQQQSQQDNPYLQNQNQYNTDNQYQQEYNQQYDMQNDAQFAQEAQAQPQEDQGVKEADIIATVGTNHPLRYLGSTMGMSAIRGKR